MAWGEQGTCTRGGMPQHPHQRAQTFRAVAWCGTLRPLVLGLEVGGSCSTRGDLRIWGVGTGTPLVL